MAENSLSFTGLQENRTEEWRERDKRITREKLEHLRGKRRRKKRENVVGEEAEYSLSFTSLQENKTEEGREGRKGWKQRRLKSTRGKEEEKGRKEKRQNEMWQKTHSPAPACKRIERKNGESGRKGWKSRTKKSVGDYRGMKEIEKSHSTTNLKESKKKRENGEEGGKFRTNKSVRRKRKEGNGETNHSAPRT